MNYENILFQVTDGVAVITLNRPKAWNALCTRLNTELEDALLAAEQDPEVRVVILTGGDKVFAAGADLKEMAQATPMEAARTSALAQRINNFLEQMSVPVIAAVSGLALGGGCELALACDFRVVAEDAQFGLPEVGLGILPGAGGTQRLAALAGAARAFEMVLLGRRISGAAAAQAGLATCAVEPGQVMAAALEMAAALKKNPAYSMALAKRAIVFGQALGAGAGKLMERELFALTFANPDQAEGMRAFAEKRSPSFQNLR